MKRPPLPFLLPIMAVLFVVLWGGGLGTIFILLAKSGAGKWGVVVLGLGIVVLVPALATLITLPKRNSLR